MYSEAAYLEIEERPRRFHRVKGNDPVFFSNRKNNKEIIKTLKKKIKELEKQAREYKHNSEMQEDYNIIMRKLKELERQKTELEFEF
jgi:predicted ATP-binding protein involved in virulence